MPLKHFKQRTQKTISSKHAQRRDLNGRDAGLMRNRFECPRRRLCLWTDKRASLLRRAGIADAHRNRALDRGLNCFWMQDLRSEVSKLGGFAIRQTLYSLRFGNDSRIGG